MTKLKKKCIKYLQTMDLMTWNIHIIHNDQHISRGMRSLVGCVWSYKARDCCLAASQTRVQRPSRVQEVHNPSQRRVCVRDPKRHGCYVRVQVLFSPPTRPSEDSTILKTSWSPATWTKPGKFQSIDGPLLCCHVLKIFEERAMIHDVYNRIEVAAA